MVSVPSKLTQAATSSSVPSNILTTEDLTSALSPMVTQIENLTKQQNETVSTVKSMQQALTSMISAQSSTKHSDAEKFSADVEHLRQRVEKQNELLSKLTETVSSSEVHQLPSGETITAQDVKSLTMMRQITEDVATLQSSIEANTAEVHKKSTVTFDSESMGQWAAQKIDATIKTALDETFEKNRASLVSTGESIVKDISAASKADIGDQAAKWERHNKAVKEAEQFRERMQNDLNPLRWAWVMLPFLMAVTLVAGTSWGVIQATGVQEIAHWGWGLALGEHESVWHRVGGVVVLGFELVLFVALTWWTTVKAAAALDKWGHPVRRWRDKSKI